jgi:hypothetical protein
MRQQPLWHGRRQRNARPIDYLCNWLTLQLAQLRAEGIEGHSALARALNARRVPTPKGADAWTHTTVARVMVRAAT